VKRGKDKEARVWGGDGKRNKENHHSSTGIRPLNQKEGLVQKACRRRKKKHRAKWPTQGGKQKRRTADPKFKKEEMGRYMRRREKQGRSKRGGDNPED